MAAYQTNTLIKYNIEVLKISYKYALFLRHSLKYGM